MAAKVIVVGQGGGGVGKTTVAVALATELAKRGKVLVFDCDKQAQLCSWLGIAKGHGMRRWINSIYVEGDSIDVDPVSQYVIKDVRPNLDVMPSNEGLAAEVENAGRRLPLSIMRQIMGAISEGYDYVLADTNPGDALAEMFWLAADLVIVPAPVTAIDMDKLANFVTLFPTAFAKAKVEKQPEVWIVPNKFNSATSESFTQWQDMKDSFEGSNWKVFHYPLKASVAISKSFEAGQSMMEFESNLETARLFRDGISILVEDIVTMMGGLPNEN